MARRPGEVEEDNLTYRQVEEFVSNVLKRIPGLKTLKVEVDDNGDVSFEFEVIKTLKGKGRV